MVRKLPIGIQDFAKLRTGSHVYIDKTALIHKLISGPEGVYFLSRPRRFGKSLLCSTLKAIFEGRRELFQNIGGFPALAIDSLIWEWKKYPVIMLLLNSGEYLNGSDDVQTSLNQMLAEIAKDERMELRGNNLKDQFKYLIKDLSEKYSEKVVVIIDEYDKPLLDTIDTLKYHLEIRNVLKSFYGVLKSSDEYLKMSFITGVTKFSQVSIFSDLNHLTDLTFNTKYADICGLTQAEVEKHLEPEIIAALNENDLTRDEYLEQLRAFYNGYRFTEKDLKVFNPFGLLQHFFNEGKFSSYWYNTGSPTFLIKLINEQKINILELKDKRVNENAFTKFDIENLDALPILYQTGYLTISDFDTVRKEFILNYPNLEVRSAFTTSLAEQFLLAPNHSAGALVNTLPGAFMVADMDEALITIQQYIASIPYDIIKNTENFYHTVFHIIFSMLGLDCRSEIRIAAGRIDSIVKTKTHIFCFEFKLDKPAKDALKKIDTKEYMLPFSGEGKKIVKIGVSFSSEKRNIEEWEIVSK